MTREIGALSEEIDAAGATGVFAGDLSVPSNAKSLRAQPNGEVLRTDGPYLEARWTSAVFAYWSR
jgi:hypothetical protein